MGNKDTATRSTTAPNQDAMAQYQALLQRAQGVANTPYQAYTGDLVAPVNAQQRAGIDNINSNSGFAFPFIQQAAGYANSAASPVTAQDIQYYTDPYTQRVIQATQNQFNNQNAVQQQGVVGNAASQGALGGDRVGVAQAQTAEAQQRAEAPVIAGLESQGYSQALAAAQNQKQMQAQGAYSLGNLGVAGQNAMLSGANAQIGAGNLMQNTDQQKLAAMYQQFQMGQAFPYQQTQWLAGLDTGVGSQMGGTSTTTPPPPNPWNTVAGLGMAGVGMIGGTQGFGQNGWFNNLFHKDGGRVPGFAEGGAPAMPYADASSWIPGSQITHGQGAPKPPGTGQPTAGVQKMVSDATAMANALKQGAKTPGVGQTGPSPEMGFGDGPLYAEGGGVGNRFDEAMSQFSPGQQRNFETNLTPKDEINFQRWKQRFAPSDSGFDYDLRGAFKSGLTPDAATAHWPDTYKKPNHSTFSDQSVYATDAPHLAGSWNGETYRPPRGYDMGGTPTMAGFGGSMIPQAFGHTANYQQVASSGVAPPGTVAPGAVTGPGGLDKTGVMPGGVGANPYNGGIVPPDQGGPYLGGMVGNPDIAGPGGPYMGGMGNNGLDQAPGMVTGTPIDQGGGYKNGVNIAPGMPPIDRGGFIPPGLDQAPGMVTGMAQPAQPPTGQPLPTQIGFPGSSSAGSGNMMGGSGRARGGFADGGSDDSLNPRNWLGFQTEDGGGGTFEPMTDRPPSAQKRPLAGFEDLPPEITGEGSKPLRADPSDSAGVGALAFADPEGPSGGSHAPQSGFGGPGLGQALMAAGFKMMSSRSPYFGVAAGEAGEAGLGVYTAGQTRALAEKRAEATMKRQEEQTNIQRASVKNSADRLMKEAQWHADQIAAGDRRATEALAERKAQHDAQNDPEQVAKIAAAKRGPTAMSEAAIEIAARQVANGDLSALTNVGRGTQGDQKLTAIKNKGAEILMDEMGMSPKEAAAHMSDKIQTFKAAGVGRSAEARTAGTREANLNLILRATDAAIPAALEQSEAVARTGWVPINKLIQKGQVIASSPELKEFGMANLQLAEHWARAMNPTGVMRESDRDRALEFLSTADSKETYRRAVMQLKKQIDREYAAVKGMRADAPINATQAAPAPGADLNVGDVRKGYKYLGGDPDKKDSWEKQ